MRLEGSTFRDWDVSRETQEGLQIYLDLLLKWNPRINLVAPGTLSCAVDRHFRDSAQICRWHKDPGPSWVDLGSGGGFPGMVCAIILKETHPETKVSLIERDLRKAAFLREVSQRTGTSVSVHSQPIEHVTPKAASTVSARALAPLVDLLDLVERHLAPTGKALLMKGKQSQSEIDEARVAWRFNSTSHPSITDEQAVILEIGALQRV